MSEQASRFTGTIPEYYDKHLGPLLFNGYAADLADRVAAYEPASVLELAAGTGILTRRLRDRLGENCELTATDLNAPMLEVARTRFAEDERVVIEAADAMALKYPRNRFEVIACQFGVMFFPDKLCSYKETLRVLQSGGSYVFNSWGPWRNNPFAEVAHETVSSFFPDDPPGFYKVPFHYHDKSEIEADLTKAGFVKIRLEDVNLTSTIPSVEHFAKGLVFGNPLFEEISERGGNPNDVVSAIAQAIRRDIGSSLNLHAVVIQATKPV